MHIRFYFGVVLLFGTAQRWWLHDIGNVLNAAKLFTVKGLIRGQLAGSV